MQLLPDHLEAQIELDESEKPQGEIEQALASIWKDVLNLAEVGRNSSFFDLGGNSLLIGKLLIMIRNRFKSQISLRYLFEATTIAFQAKYFKGDKLENHIENLEEEARLPEHIRPDSSPRHITHCCLLTGATGFVGAYLLWSLLQDPEQRVICLVRAGGLEYLKSQFIVFGIELSQSQWDRVEVIPADLSKEDFGLDKKALSELSFRVDCIYHCASIVAMTLPFAALKPVNVDAVKTLLSLACADHPKRFIYISTIGVFDQNDYNELCNIPEDSAVSSLGLSGGYEQSKWVAERLVGTALSRGLDGLIFRLGRIGSALKWGLPNPHDYAWLFIKGCIKLGLAPPWGECLDQTPGDWLGKIIVAMSNSEKKDEGVIHLLSDPIPYKEMIEILNSCGFPIQYVPFEQWLEALKKQADNPLSPILATFEGQTSPQVPSMAKPKGFWDIFDLSKTRRLLKGHGTDLPTVKEEHFRMYLKRYEDAGLL